MRAMNTATTLRRPRSLVLGTLVASMLGAGCHVRETRVTTPEADYAAELVRSRVETRTGKKKPTWKPIVMGVIAGVTAGAVAMVWTGFLQPNRPLAVSGIVLAVTVPTLGSIPFLIEQDQPWTKTEWDEWQPVRDGRATVEVMGRDVKPLSTHALVTDAEGKLQVPLAQLCDAPMQGKSSELHLVDVVVRVPDPKSEPAVTTMPVDRLPAPCGGGRLSLFRPQAPASEPSKPTAPSAQQTHQDHQDQGGGEHEQP